MATLIIVAVLGGLVVPPDQSLPGAAAFAMLALQIAVCPPRMRAFRDRYGARVLAAQLVLVPLGGPPGFLAATVLLVAPRRMRWALLAGVVAAAGALNTATLYTCLNAMGNALCQGLLVFALTRLADLRDELMATRGELAAGSVTGERARVSDALENALGGALSQIIRLAGEGRPAAILERAAEARAAVRSAPAPAAPPPLPDPGDLTPRTALPIIVVGHLWYPLIAVVFLVSEGTPPGWLAVYTADIVAVVALQAHHVRPRPPGVAPRWAAWTLTAQALLAAAPLLAPERPYPQLMWLAAGAILIVLAEERPGWAWTLTAGYVALVPATLLAAGRGPLEAALWTAETAGGAMMFYGLALLTRLVYRVHEARVSLALLAVAEERRRIARDVHDLLGSGLWTIMVKADLAARDPDRAGESLADVAAAARRTLGDLRAIPDGAAAPSAAAELGSARELLAAAGADVTVSWPRDLALPGPVDALFGTVLREAVTNVLRHSAARRCLLEASRDGDRVRLRVVNDGTGDVPSGAPGQGVANLTARAGALGGTLRVRNLPDGAFELTLLQPAGVGRDPDGVEPVARP